MALDAIIIAEAGAPGSGDIIHQRLRLDGRVATIQVIQNYLENNGQIAPPIKGAGVMNWGAAHRLNGIYLLDYLQKEGLQVQLIDRYFKEKKTFQALLEENPRAVIISTTFIRNRKALNQLVADIRDLAPDIFIIAGGPLVHLSHAMLKRSREPEYETRLAEKDFLFFKNAQPDVDLFILGLQGEDILAEVLRRLKSGRSLSDLSNTARLNGSGYRFSEFKDYVIDNLNAAIDWHALPEEIFASGVVPIQTSKGCPFSCAFCNFIKDRRLMFIKPVDTLVNELKAVSDRGVQFVRFTDDNFRHGRLDINHFCERLVSENIHIQWMTMIRANALEKADFNLLRQAGCIEVLLGLESADPQILKNMNKKANPGLYVRVVEKLLAAGITASCYFLFGFPGETRETVLRTREFLAHIQFPNLPGTLTWTFFPFGLAPLSPVYEPEMRKKFRLTGYMDHWRHETMASDEVKDHIERVFLSLDDSTPMYRNDNQKMLQALPDRVRKRLLIARHRLAKKALEKDLKPSEILNTFGPLMGSETSLP